MLVAVATYAVTKTFPAEERWGLIDQMRRAAVSIGSNISEGCGRATNKQFAASLHVAMGEAWELEYQVRLPERLGFGDASSLDDLLEKIVIVKKMMAGLAAYLRRSA